MPEQIVKGGPYAPTAQRMKESRRRIGRFVCMKLVEQIMRRVIAIHELCECFAQRGNLGVVEDAQAGQIALGVKEFNLISSEAIWGPVMGSCRPVEKLRYR